MKYWFYIESYIYIKKDDSNVFFYNCLNSKSFLFKLDNLLLQLINQIILPENMNCIEIDYQTLKNKSINDFVRIIRKNYLGDVISKRECRIRPVIFSPMLNFQKQIQIIHKERVLPDGANVKNYLHEISLHIDNSLIDNNKINTKKNLPDELLSIVLTKILEIPAVHLNIVGDIFSYPFFSKLKSLLKVFSISKSYTIPYLNIIPNRLKYILNDFKKIIFIIDFPFNEQQFKKEWNLISNINEQIEFVFNVTSEKECIKAEEIKTTYAINNYILKPKFTGTNSLFFKQNVYLTEEDILKIPHSLHEIYRKQVLNTNEFGRINIMYDGNVHGNINLSAVGNIERQSLSEIIFKELTIGKSWLCIRNMKPCNKCIYQWLCPSLSNYEIVIGKPNLCHVKS